MCLQFWKVCAKCLFPRVENSYGRSENGFGKLTSSALQNRREISSGVFLSGVTRPVNIQAIVLVKTVLFVKIKTSICFKLYKEAWYLRALNSCDLFENGFGKLTSCILQICHVKVYYVFHSGVTRQLNTQAFGRVKNKIKIILLHKSAILNLILLWC